MGPLLFRAPSHVWELAPCSEGLNPLGLEPTTPCFSESVEGAAHKEFRPLQRTKQPNRQQASGQARMSSRANEAGEGATGGPTTAWVGRLGRPESAGASPLPQKLLVDLLTSSLAA